MKHFFFRSFIIAATSLALFMSCGIDNYIYLAPVSSINRSIDTITVSLPNADQPEDFFLGYKIYYKIYLSTQTFTSVIATSDFVALNTILNSDYSKISPYLSTDSVVSINMDSFFKDTLAYYQLKVANNDLQSLLAATSLNNSFTLQKTNSSLSIIISSNEYNLQRSVSDNSSVFAYLGITGNDVVTLDNHSTGYVVFYIFAYGTDEYGASIFSKPAFLGVLQLPQ
ncbi:hypothetical protein [Gracilinema caldarium]|uniref:hypothetical protein n=1 Tax=Gracilinema caldarium TaxID=215591 RepID=UPI0026F1FA30|nr:hypothetical protein [Gracilinema caldarium]